MRVNNNVSNFKNPAFKQMRVTKPLKKFLGEGGTIDLDLHLKGSLNRKFDLLIETAGEAIENLGHQGVDVVVGKNGKYIQFYAVDNSKISPKRSKTGRILPEYATKLGIRYRLMDTVGKAYKILAGR